MCFFQFLETFLHQKSYEVDMLAFSLFLRASPIDYCTAVTMVWRQSMIR